MLGGQTPEECSSPNTCRAARSTNVPGRRHGHRELQETVAFAVGAFGDSTCIASRGFSPSPSICGTSSSKARPSGAVEIRRTSRPSRSAVRRVSSAPSSAVAAHHGAVGEGDLNRGRRAVQFGRVEKPRAAIEQGTEAPRPLRTGQPAGLDVDESVCAISRHTTQAEQDLFHLFALQRFDGVAAKACQTEAPVIRRYCAR